MKTVKEKVTGVRLPPDLLDTLNELAAIDGRSLSNLIIKLLRDALAAQEKTSTS